MADLCPHAGLCAFSFALVHTVHRTWSGPGHVDKKWYVYMMIIYIVGVYVCLAVAVAFKIQDIDKQVGEYVTYFETSITDCQQRACGFRCLSSVAIPVCTHFRSAVVE